MKINKKEMKLIASIKNSFYDDLKIEFLYHSNHLEGSTFTKENLEKLLFEKKVCGEHFLDDVIETKNSLNVFDMVVNDAGKKLDKFMLFSWQRELIKDSVDEEINDTGCYKKYENRLRGLDLKLASPSMVDSMMFNLLSDYNENDNIIINDIATFHYRFELIHPFQDGNGRIGRFIILKQCIDNNIDLIAIDNEYEDEYKKALYKAQKYDDVKDLVDVFIKCQKRLDEKFVSYNDMLSAVKKECL